MSSSSFLNVFSGENALNTFYDPDSNPPTPLVELPERLNPYRKDGVRVYAKLMSHLPATNVKSLPALNMLLRAQESGEITKNTHTIAEYSSGSTVISLGILCHIMGIPNVKAFLSNKTPQSKLDLLRFFGLDLTLFGGHGQPEPMDPNGGIFVANEVGEQENVYNPDQYSNPKNYEAHIRWSGPQIIKQLPDISIFAASIGTSGTMTGTGLYLKSVRPSITRVGVCTNPDDRVPGPRSLSLLAPVDFPWRESVEHVEEIPSYESFEASLNMCRNGLLVGPSSGMALLGVFKYIERAKKEGRLDALRNENGEIPCAFICCDQPFQYIADYHTKLGPSHFLPITNEELKFVDFYSYNIDWELTPSAAFAMLQGSSPATILDLRNASDVASYMLKDAVYIDVNARDSPNPYKHPATMISQFKRLDVLLSKTSIFAGELSSEAASSIGDLLDGKTVVILSYKGHVARLAMSILRNRGVTAHCVMGGTEALEKEGLWDRMLRREVQKARPSFTPIVTFMPLPTLSERGRVRLENDVGPTPRFNPGAGKFYHKEKNPTGVIMLSIAENSLMTAELLDYMQGHFKLTPTHLKYRTNLMNGFTENTSEALPRYINAYANAIVPVTATQCVVGPGLGALFAQFVWAVCDEGDGVLMTTPYYADYPRDIVYPACAKVVPAHVPADVDSLSLKSIEYLENTIVESIAAGTKIKVLLLCNPHNPIAQAYPVETITAYAALAEKHNLHLLVDEVYANQVFASSHMPNPTPFVSILSLDNSRFCNPSRIHVLAGPTKDFGASGLKVGAFVSQHNSDMVKMMRASMSAIPVSSASDALFTPLLNDVQFREWFLEENRKRLAEAFEVAATWAVFHKLKFTPASAGVYFLVDFAPVMKGDTIEEKLDNAVACCYGLSWSVHEAYERL